MIKAIIFDCFGVITSDGLEALITELEVASPDVRSQVSAIITQANRGQIDVGVSRSSISAILGITPEEYAAQVKAREFRNNELLHYIIGLRSTYKTALLSNISRPGLEKRFPKTELKQYFDMQFVSGELGIAKPDKEIYEHALRELDVLAEECIFIDDRENYLAPARELGITTILFTTNEQFYKDLQPYLA